MSAIRFRPATAEDAAAIQECVVRAYAEDRGRIPDLPDVSGGIAEDIEAHPVIIAETRAEIVGVVVFDIVQDAVMVFNLAVAPMAQGQGLARKLLHFAEKQALDSQCSRLRLRTHRLMHDTVAMYHHLGWVETERKENGITMEKDIQTVQR